MKKRIQAKLCILVILIVGIHSGSLSKATENVGYAYGGQFSINVGNPAASLRCDEASIDFLNIVTSVIPDYAGMAPTSTVTSAYIAEGWVVFDKGMSKDILLDKVNSISFATSNVIQFSYQKLGKGWPEGSRIILRKAAPFYYRNTVGKMAYVTLDACYVITVNPNSQIDGKVYHTVKIERFEEDVVFPDVYVPKRGTVELRNSQNNTDLFYTFSGPFVKGSTIRFEVETTATKPVALWILGDGSWDKECYANGYINSAGKKTIVDTIEDDLSKITIYVQYRNNNYEKDTVSDKTTYFTNISNIEILIPRAEPSGVKGDATGDGSVDLKDVIRAKRELAGLAGKDGVPGASKDLLLSGRHVVLESDLLSLKEIILRNGNIAKYPIYLDDQEMMISAFQSPVTFADVSGGLSEEQIRAEFKKYTDAGFNTVYAQEAAPFYGKTVTGRHDAWEVVDKYMDYAEDSDVDVILYSEVLTSYLKNWGYTLEDVKEELRELWIGEDTSTGSYKGMKERKNFAGLMMADEIHHSSLEYFQTSVDIIQALNSNIGVLGSHLSMDADCTLLTGVADSNGGQYTYNERAKDFAEFAKTVGALSGTYKYGMYPLYDEAKSGYDAYDVNRLWLYNLQTLAQVAKDNDFEMAMTLQGHGYSPFDIRKPETKRDIGFLNYTALAYGSKAFTYYTYGHCQWTDENGSIETNDNIYHAVKAVNEEIKSIDHVFLEFDWEGTMVDRNRSTEQLYYKRTGTYGSYDMESFYTSNDRIQSFNATAPALLGCFEDKKQGFDGFWLVNATNPYKNLSTKITMKFNDASSILIYDPASKDGTPLEITYDVSAGYSVSLASGTGIFIIPISG